jgi:GT2 family glycosyltransferase
VLDLEPRPTLEDITIVIPTLGRPILEQCLCCIVAGSAWPGGLIVVDQGSSQQVAAWIERLRELGIAALHVPSSERGRAAGVNRGLERVQTRFVAVTDDDCFVETDWLERMVARLRNRPEAIVTGRIEAAGQGVTILNTSQAPAIYHRPRLKFDTMSGGNMGTSVAVIARVGWFDQDPRLRTAEDAEWAYRALRISVPIVYAPEVAVSHVGWRDEVQRVAQYRGYARSQGGFYGKYLRKGDMFIALRAIIHHLRAMRRWVRGLVTGDREMALVGRAYLTGLLPGILAGIKGNESR